MNALNGIEKTTGPHRLTGRTERMLIKIASSVLAGEGNVMIACLNIKHGVELLDRLQRIFETQPGLKITRKLDNLQVNDTRIRVVFPVNEQEAVETDRRARWITDHAVCDRWMAAEFDDEL